MYASKKGSYHLIVTLFYTPSIPREHNQRIRTLFEAHIVLQISRAVELQASLGWLLVCLRKHIPYVHIMYIEVQ